MTATAPDEGSPAGASPASGPRWGAIAFAAGVLALVAGWILTGGGLSERIERPAPFTRTVDADSSQPDVSVRAADSVAAPYQASVTLPGWTGASRAVSVRSETRGRVIALPVMKGGAVEAGAVIARLEVGEREARRRKALADLERWRFELGAARELAERGYNARSTLANAEASLEAARAELATVEKSIKDTTIVAPFAGILDRLDVEIGDLVEAGAAIGLVADLDPLVVRGQVSEHDRARLAASGPARARLLDGTVHEGRIRYLSAIADARTRTFPVEIELDNADGTLVDGLTAEISIPTTVVAAHLVPASVLTLDGDGRLGVKALSSAQEVRFIPVRIEAHRADGVLVSGLPESVRVIVVGQDFVRPGQVLRGTALEPMRAYLGAGG